MPCTIDEAIQRLREHTAAMKPRILRPARGILRRPYLAAGDTYPDLTDWDAIWAGIGFMLEGDPEPLRDSLLNLIEHIAPDGKGQRRIGFQRYSATPYQIRPFVMSGCYALSRRIGCDWLGDNELELLHRHLLYWHINRTGREGLIRWLHVDEGFADNGLGNWAWEGSAVQGTDLNAQLVREHLALAWILNERGQSARAAEHREYAARLTQRIEACLWQEDFGGYCSLYNPPERYRASEPVRVRHYTNLWPLWVGITPPERARRVITEQILNPERFRAAMGLRSMAKDEVHFNNMRSGYINPMSSAPQVGPAYESLSSNWQGPVWAVPTWLAVMALRRYGFAAEGQQMAEDYIIFLAERLAIDGGFPENYHSETGAPLHAMGMGSWYMLIWHLVRGDEADLFPAWPG